MGRVAAVGYQQAGRPLSALPAHPWCARRGQPDERQAGPLRCWLRRLVERRGHNKAVVALANKNARIAWALIAGPRSTAPQRACAQPMP
ncbi:MAG: hypothetical protein M5R42_02050 [Rhodocyclaceae bacterium]|nr:hypothetical protein [Rhodocyclaceae bacterium]